MTDIIKQNELFKNFASDGLLSLANSLEQTSNNIKTINHTHNFNITKEIILSGVLFGSVYLSSIALYNINELLMTKYSDFRKTLIIFNTSIFIGSGYMFYTFSKLYK